MPEGIQIISLSPVYFTNENLQLDPEILNGLPWVSRMKPGVDLQNLLFHPDALAYHRCFSGKKIYNGRCSIFELVSKYSSFFLKVS